MVLKLQNYLISALYFNYTVSKANNIHTIISKFPPRARIIDNVKRLCQHRLHDVEKVIRIPKVFRHIIGNIILIHLSKIKKAINCF